MAVVRRKFVISLCVNLFHLLIPNIAKTSSSEDINNHLLVTIQSYMNSQIDPCEDFYEYACGNWAKALEFEGKSGSNAFSALENDYNDILENMLSQDFNLLSNALAEVFYKLKLYYKTCKDQNSFNITYYMEILKPKDNFEWPQENESWSIDSTMNIWSLLGKLLGVGFNDLLFQVKVERHNATCYRLELDKFKDNSYERRIAYHKSFSSNVKIKAIGQSMNLFFEKLYKINYNNMESTDIEMTFSKLHQEMPNIDFLSYFSAFMGEEQLAGIPVIVKNLPYFRQLGELLKNTTHETLIHIIKMSLEGYLQEITPRNCMENMRTVLYLPLDYIYELTTYKGKRKFIDKVVEKIFKALKEKFLEILHEHSHEFSAQEMEFLQAKVNKMKLNIGIPQSVNETYFSQHYSDWLVQKHNFYYNHLKALQHKIFTKFSLLAKPDTFTSLHLFSDWPLDSPSYAATENLVIIPFSYLNFPAFHMEFYDLFQYAGLGNTLAHEMMHGLSTNGLQYDSNGRPSTMFARKLPSNITNSLECLQEILTFNMEERIADVRGFRLAYDTYFEQSVVTDYTTKLNFTNKQLFYLKFAQFFCANDRISAHDISHDLPSTRVFQTATNSQEFGKVFGCSQEVHQIAGNKCNLWLRI